MHSYSDRNKSHSLQLFLVEKGLKKGRSPSRAKKQKVRNWTSVQYTEAVLEWLGHSSIKLKVPPHGTFPKPPKGCRWVKHIKASELYIFSLKVKNCVGWNYLNDYRGRLELSCLVDCDENLIAVVDLDGLQCQFDPTHLKPGVKKWLRKVIDLLAGEVEQISGLGYTRPQSQAGLKLAKALWPICYSLSCMKRRYEVFM